MNKNNYNFTQDIVENFGPTLSGIGPTITQQPQPSNIIKNIDNVPIFTVKSINSDISIGNPNPACLPGIPTS